MAIEYFQVAFSASLPDCGVILPRLLSGAPMIASTIESTFELMLGILHLANLVHTRKKTLTAKVYSRSMVSLLKITSARLMTEEVQPN